MITGLHTVSEPQTLVEIKQTLKVPTVVKAWTGVVAVEVVPSPKSHVEVELPPPEVWFVKEPTFALVVKLKLAEGAGQLTVIDWQNVLEPQAFTAVKQTWYTPGAA